MDVTAIVAIEPGDHPPFVPPMTDYRAASVTWTETEFHCHDIAAQAVRVGYWIGEPGRVEIDSWPYTEICSIVRGRVAVVDRVGTQREFGAGEAFIVPKGFVGAWLTLEPSAKIFVVVE